MPAVGIPTSGNNKEYVGNLTPYVLATCIVAAMGGLIFGYDIGISGNFHFFFHITDVLFDDELRI